MITYRDFLTHFTNKLYKFCLIIIKGSLPNCKTSQEEISIAVVSVKALSQGSAQSVND